MAELVTGHPELSSISRAYTAYAAGSVNTFFKCHLWCIANLRKRSQNRHFQSTILVEGVKKGELCVCMLLIMLTTLDDPLVRDNHSDVQVRIHAQHGSLYNSGLR